MTTYHLSKHLMQARLFRVCVGEFFNVNGGFQSEFCLLERFVHTLIKFVQDNERLLFHTCFSAFHMWHLTHAERGPRRVFTTLDLEWLVVDVVS